MPRENRQLDLRSDTWQQLEQIKLALGHDEMEETVETLINLGLKAVSITDLFNRTVKLIGGERQLIGDPCKHCGFQRTHYPKEASVKIGVDEQARLSQQMQDQLNLPAGREEG